MMKSKKPLLKILKVSNIYGGILSLLTIGAYLFFTIGFPGTFRYLPIQAVLLPSGIILVAVFSYLHLSYYEKASDEAVCSLPIGAIITLMCLIPGLIIALFEINILSMGMSTLLLHPWMLGIFIFGNFGLVLGFLSIFTVLRSNRIRIVPNELEKWKIKGLQLSTVILIAGVIVTGISVSLGTVGKAVISYEVRLDTGTSEETTFFLPVPIDESIGDVADVMNELKVVDGAADWKIVDTAHGKALEVNTKAKCVLFAKKECGYKGWEEGDEWLYSYNVSMFQGINKNVYEVWVFTSTANTIVRIDLSLDDGQSNLLNYISVGSTPTDPFTYEIPLKEGWQTVKLERSLLCYD